MITIKSISLKEGVLLTLALSGRKMPIGIFVVKLLQDMTKKKKKKKNAASLVTNFVLPF
jgi:hypothetical protein